MENFKQNSEQRHHNFGKSVANFLQWILNAALLILAVILVVFLGKEVYALCSLLVSTSEDKSYLFLEQIVEFFLYFEFLALIVKYFKTNYHFPLRYFLYIGITAMVRLIIVDHSNSLDSTLFAGAILLMVIALFVVSSDRLNKS